MEKMGKNLGPFPKALVLVPPKNISYQTQSVLIPCPPHRIAPLSVFGESDHKTEAKRLVCLKQQVVTRKPNSHHQDVSPELSETYNQDKALSSKNTENSEKLCPQNYSENNLGLFFRNKMPYTFRAPHAKRHKIKISTSIKSGGTKDQVTEEPKNASHKATTGPNPSASGAEKAAPQVHSKKTNKGTIKRARGPDPCSKDTSSSKNKQLVQIPVGSRQIWEELCHQGKDHLGSNKQARFEVICPHHTRIHFIPDDQTTYILKRHLKVPSSVPENEAQKQWENFSHDYKHQIIPVYHQQQAQAALDFVSRTLVPLYQRAIKCEESINKAIRRQLNKNNWENFFQCHDHHLAIPLCRQNQARAALDLFSEVSLPRNHIHLKSAGPRFVRKSAKKLNKRSWTKCPCDYDHHVTIPLCHLHQVQDLIPRILLPPDHIHTKYEAPLNMIFECQRKCHPFTRPLPGPLYSSRPLLIKALPIPDCWTPETLPISERHSKTPFHLSIQDIPAPQKLTLNLTKVPKCHHYQAKSSRVSDYQPGYQYKIQPEQSRGRARSCLPASCETQGYLA
ncbi:uncharacterized protein LOC103096911 [Monodelphis domestica]|uniref:uncharacterized protein LOC103096911 n=1 Tax=Monodelphis domestica TaxID=13616 RepID=UPI0024E2612B|nr:uncharacterized protein LOC103096911 [Monodelphis domestica]